MERAIVVHGRLSAPQRIELDEPVTELKGEVEVVLRSSPREPAAKPPRMEESIFDFIARLPGGARTKADIDQQIRAERDSWGDR